MALAHKLSKMADRVLKIWKSMGGGDHLGVAESLFLRSNSERVTPFHEIVWQ